MLKVTTLIDHVAQHGIRSGPCSAWNIPMFPTRPATVLALALLDDSFVFEVDFAPSPSGGCTLLRGAAGNLFHKIKI